jgi:hypothetical protein
MEALAQNPGGLSVADRTEFHFGLAKAYEDIGRPDDAFRQLLAGNALKRRDIVYEEAAILDARCRNRALESFILRSCDLARDLVRKVCNPSFRAGTLFGTICGRRH